MFYVALRGKESKWKTKQRPTPRKRFGAATFQYLHKWSAKELFNKTISLRWRPRNRCTKNSFRKNRGNNQRNISDTRRILWTKSSPKLQKTQVYAYHLRNHEAKKELNIQWQGVRIDHVDNPKYLGVKLGRVLIYKVHCEDNGKKLQQEIIYSKN